MIEQQVPAGREQELTPCSTRGRARRPRGAETQRGAPAPPPTRPKVCLPLPPGPGASLNSRPRLPAAPRLSSQTRAPQGPAGPRPAHPPLAVQHVLNAGLGDDGVVTLEPLVLVLPDEAGVVAALQGPLVVDHRKQGVPGLGGQQGGSLNSTSSRDRGPHGQRPVCGEQSTDQRREPRTSADG